MLEALAKSFEEIYQTKPLLFQAPGRINLIGEHTDYNHGLVFPAAIDKRIYFAVAKNEENPLLINITSKDFNESKSFYINPIELDNSSWIKYMPYKLKVTRWVV
jgi:galactokinase